MKTSRDRLGKDKLLDILYSLGCMLYFPLISWRTSPLTTARFFIPVDFLYKYLNGWSHRVCEKLRHPSVRQTDTTRFINVKFEIGEEFARVLMYIVNTVCFLKLSFDILVVVLEHVNLYVISRTRIILLQSYDHGTSSALVHFGNHSRHSWTYSCHADEVLLRARGCTLLQDTRLVTYCCRTSLSVICSHCSSSGGRWHLSHLTDHLILSTSPVGICPTADTDRLLGQQQLIPPTDKILSPPRGCGCSQLNMVNNMTRIGPPDPYASKNQFCFKSVFAIGKVFV